MRLGLTGGIGCGVSQAGRRFAELGAQVISADQVGHNVLLVPEVKLELVRVFGEDVCKPDGEINRSRLGSLVFADEQARERLNEIIHPPLLQRLKSLAEAAEASYQIPVVDAALIYEWGVQKFFHRIIVVNASLEIRLQRIIVRDRLSRDQALERTRAQMPLEEKVAGADYVIENEGTLEELYRQVDEVWAEIGEST